MIGSTAWVRIRPFADPGVENYGFKATPHAPPSGQPMRAFPQPVCAIARMCVGWRRFRLAGDDD